MDSTTHHRPRNVDWQRAAALLYGDWGTSKAYVLGLAFFTAAYASLPIILAVSLLTAIVGYNYIIVCRHFPDGGGVYSAARHQSRMLAVMGALLLVANFTVTAAMSGWAAMHYFRIPTPWIPWATAALLVGMGLINFFGPKHTGSLAVLMAIPMVAVVVLIVLLSLPHLTTQHLTPFAGPFLDQWKAFTGVILALSGVEAIANLTGVMKLDPSSSMDQPRVGRTAARAILPVAIEVVLGTCLLGWAMLSVDPQFRVQLAERWEDMIRFLAEHYGRETASGLFGAATGDWFGRTLGVVTGLVVGILLLSAVNTALAALIGLVYMLARDDEMPRSFLRLNPHGVPWLPLVASVLLPVVVILFSSNLESLAGLYAIGVVGAITVNLASCTFNPALGLHWFHRALMGATAFLLFAVEITIAKTKPDALFFAVCVLGLGLGLRAYTHKRAGLQTVTVRPTPTPASLPANVPFDLQPQPSQGQIILVAARGLTPVLRFALEEARLRKATLYVLYVKELAVAFAGSLPAEPSPRWQNDPQAAAIMQPILELGRINGVQVIPIYTVSDNTATTILDMAATLGVDILMLGSPHRNKLVALLKGNVVTEVARNLPENIQLLIHG